MWLKGVKIYYKESMTMERPLRDTAKRLKFAIHFAAMDLDNMRPGDWLNLKDDLASFLDCKRRPRVYVHTKGAVLVNPSEQPLPGEYTDEDFRALQQDTNLLLQSLVWDGGFTAGMLDIHAYVGIVPLPETTDYVHCVQGATRDVFLLYLWLLIREEGIDRIRRCPECNKMFYRVAKQQYCTRACTNRANVRTWRQREEAEQSASDQPG
jgi:hypothetical protein